MGKDGFKYFLICVGLYLAISGIEIFLLSPLVDFISEGFWIHLLVYTILLLIANPILTKFISNKLEFVYSSTYHKKVEVKEVSEDIVTEEEKLDEVIEAIDDEIEDDSDIKIF